MVEQNIEKIVKYLSSTFLISFIYSYNWLNIIQFPEFYYKMKTKYPKMSVFLNKVSRPSYWALETAPLSYKKQIAYTLTHHLDRYSHDWGSTRQQDMVKELKGIRDILLNDKTRTSQNIKNYRTIFKIEKYREGSIIDVVQEIEDRYILDCPDELKDYSVAEELRTLYNELTKDNQI